MQSILYNLIEFGCDPCIFKLVSHDWKDQIEEIDHQVERTIQWRLPEYSLIRIIHTLIDTNDIQMIKRALLHVSTPLINWNIMSYLIESRDIANVIYTRIKNSHTREMCRRLSIPLSIPEKEIFKISSSISGQSSTSGLKSISSIISHGYTDALDVLFKSTAISSEQLYTLINVSLSMIGQEEQPFNPYIICWLYKNHYTCLPQEIIDIIDNGNIIYYPKYNSYYLSLDIPNPKIKMISLNILYQLGKNMLNTIMRSSYICKRYIDRCKKGSILISDIRVFDAILTYSNNKDIIDIIEKYGWNEYIQYSI